jgi:copper type II ascorbate-dependent monooxygenase-like protein
VRRAVPLAVLAAAGLAAAGLALVRDRPATAGAAPTYYRDVAPILDGKCASCHRLGGIAPFALTTAADAKAHAAGIVRMTKAGLMPPWMPAADSAPLVGRSHRRLTSTELSTLARWAAAGAPAGDRAELKATPAPASGLTGPGTTVTLAPPRAYRPHAAGGGLDDYHCLVLDPKLTRDEYVTGALIRPGRPGIVHHVILYQASGSQVAAANRLNAANGGEGWSCFGGPGLPFDLSGPNAFMRLGQPPWVSAWVPGHVTNATPPGTGVLLHAGDEIVMQVHYNLIAAVGPDRSQVQLRLRPAATTKLIPLQTMLVAAPVELPCPHGSSGAECTRARALADETAKYGAGAAEIPSGLLAICNKTLADYPQQVGAGTSIATSCDRNFAGPTTIYGVAGHMHLRGRDIKLILDPGTSKQRTLLHIPAWDFHWQDEYTLVHPIRVGAGDTVRVQCTFDNSAADQPVVGGAQLKPRYVIWGEGTTDEMCLGLLSVATGP